MPRKRKSWYVAVKVRADAPITEYEARLLLKRDTALTHEKHYADETAQALKHPKHVVAVFTTPHVTTIKKGAEFNDDPRSL